MTSYRLKCYRCEKQFVSETPRRRVCSPCNRGHRKPQLPGQHLSPGDVERILDHAVRMETQPPWVRHPQPWD